MAIVLDAMGGDKAPKEIVMGAIEASPALTHNIILVGDLDQIEKCYSGKLPDNIELVHAPEVITMEDKPIEGIRKKKLSSIVVAAKIVKNGDGKVLVSAGNTGAVAAASLLEWKQIPGFKRPAIASNFPNEHGGFILLDSGASPDISPEHLVDFAHMGMAYAQTVMNRREPRVHLLNIGSEPGKGNAFTKKAYHYLEKYDWFAGNIESKDLFHSHIDVVVCDAFVGNMVLKTGEGVAEYILHLIKEQLPTNRIARLPYYFLQKILSPLKHKLDYAEYGGSPLLGLNELSIICHGRSNAKAIKNALLQAQSAIDHHFIDHLKQKM